MLALAAERAQGVEMVGRSHEVDNVAVEYPVVATGYDGVMAAAYGRHMEIVAQAAEVLELHAHDRSVVAQFHPHEDQLPVPHLEPVAHPCALQGSGYLGRRQIFGIDHPVYAV